MSRIREVFTDESLLEFYKHHATRVLLPFWMDRALDERNGGVYTCFNNVGDKLISTDKYTWSQGRSVWVLSRLFSLCAENTLSWAPEKCLQQARKTVEFLRDHAILENSNCAFLLSETGEKKESVPGEGFDTSFYADCFVIIGFAEYARVARDDEILDLALRLYDSVIHRLERGNVRTEPYHIPEGYKSHSIPMIMLNTSQELRRALDSFAHQRISELRERSWSYAANIMGPFRLDDDTIAEMLPDDGSPTDSILYRHVNPGHALESMWFVISEAVEQNWDESVYDAATVIKRALELGWDDEHGGLLRFVDRGGGEPKGRRIGEPYERLILETWDMKLWWPHSEALYATLLANEHTEDKDLLRLYKQVHEYTFRTFPNPDGQVGEWIQIRDRQGRPVEQQVALPVKDPYHILRSVLLIIELLHHKLEKR